MPFSKQLIDELKKEEQALLKARDQIDAKLKAVRELLRPDQADLFSVRVDAPEQQKGPYAGMGLREAIRKTLSDNPAGLKPKEVTKHLEMGGFELNEDATTDLSTRVANDLSRMYRKKKIDRKDGKYKLPQ